MLRSTRPRQSRRQNNKSLLKSTTTTSTSTITSSSTNITNNTPLIHTKSLTTINPSSSTTTISTPSTNGSPKTTTATTTTSSFRSQSTSASSQPATKKHHPTKNKQRSVPEPPSKSRQQSTPSLSPQELLDIMPRSETITPPRPPSSTHHQKWIYFQASDIIPPDHRNKVFPFGLSIAIDKAEAYNMDNLRLTLDAVTYLSQLDLGVRHTCNSFAKLGTKQVKGIRLALFGSQTQIENAPWECYRGLVSEQQRLRGATLMKIPLSLAITDIDRPITQVLSPPIPTRGKLRDTYEEFVSAYTMPGSGSIGESLLHNSQDPAYNVHLLDSPDGRIQPGRVPKQFYPYLNIANALVNDTPDPQLTTSKPHLYFVQAMYRAMLSPSIVTKYSWPFGKTLYVMRNEFANNYIVEKVMKSPSLQMFCFLGERVRDTFTDEDLESNNTTVLDVMNPEHRKYIRLNFGRKFLDHQVRMHKLEQDINRETTFREHFPEGMEPKDSMDILNKMWPADMSAEEKDNRTPHPDRPTLLKLKEALERRSGSGTSAMGSDGNIYTTSSGRGQQKRIGGKNEVKLITVSEQRAQQLEVERSFNSKHSDRTPQQRMGFLFRERALMKGGVKKLLEEEEQRTKDGNNDEDDEENDDNDQANSNQAKLDSAIAALPLKRRSIVRSTSRTLAQIIQDGDYEPEVNQFTTTVQPKVLLKPDDGTEISMDNQIFEVALDPLMMGMLHPHIPLHRIRNLMYKQIKRNKEPPSIASDYVHILLNQLASIPTCTLDLPMINGITRAQGLIQQSAAAVGLSAFTDRNSNFLKTHSLAMTMSHIISRTLDFPQKHANDYHEWKVYEQHQMDAVAILRTASDVFQLALERHKTDVGSIIDQRRMKKEVQLRNAFKRKIKRGDSRYYPDDINRIAELEISDSEDEFYEDRKARTEIALKVQNGEIPPSALNQFAHLEDNDDSLIVSTPSFAFLQLPSSILHLDVAQNQSVKLDEKLSGGAKLVKPNQLRPTTMMLPYIDFLNHPMNNNQHNVFLSFDVAETTVIGDENEVKKRRDDIKKNLEVVEKQNKDKNRDGEDDDDDDSEAERARMDPDNYQVDPVTGKRTSKLRKEAVEDPSKAIETMISKEDIDFAQRLIIAMQVEIEDLETQIKDDVVLKIASKLPLASPHLFNNSKISRPTETKDKIEHLKKNIAMMEKALDVIQVPNKMVMANVVARRDIFPGEELLLAYHRLDDGDPYITSVSDVVPQKHQNDLLNVQQRTVQQNEQLRAEKVRHREQIEADLKAQTQVIQDKYDGEIMKTLELIKQLQSDLTHLKDVTPPMRVDSSLNLFEAKEEEKKIKSQQDNLKQQQNEIHTKLLHAKQDKDNLFDQMHHEVQELHQRERFQVQQEDMNRENYRWNQMTPQQLLLNYGIVMPHLQLTPVALQQLDDQTMSNAASAHGFHNEEDKQTDSYNPLSNPATKIKDYLALQEQRRNQLSDQHRDEHLAARDAVIHAKMVSHGAIPIDPNMAIIIDDQGAANAPEPPKPDEKTTTVALRRQTISEQMEEEVASNMYNINPHIEPFSLVLNMEEMTKRHITRKLNQMDFIPDVGVKDKLKIIKNAKEIIQIDSILLESREMLDLINLRVGKMQQELFNDLDDVKMTEVGRQLDSRWLDDGRIKAKNQFTTEQRIQILKDRVAVEGVIDRLQTRRDELDYVTKQGMVQTSLTELLLGNSTKTMPPLHTSLGTVNIHNNKYGYSTTIDRRTKKVLRHIDTNLEDVLHFIMDDIYQYKNNLYPKELYDNRKGVESFQDQLVKSVKEKQRTKSSTMKNKNNNDLSQQSIVNDDNDDAFDDIPEEYQKEAERNVHMKDRIEQTSFLDDLMSIPDKDARGTLLACRFLYETIATTWLEQVVLKDFVTPWEQSVRPKHLQLFSKYSAAAHSHQYRVREDISFARRGPEVAFRDNMTEEKIKVMKEFMLSKIPHPLQLMEQSYKSIWLDNSVENTNKRKLKERLTRKDKNKKKDSATPDELRKRMVRTVKKNSGEGGDDDDDDDDDLEGQSDYESEDDQYDINRHFYLDVGDEEAEEKSNNDSQILDENDPKRITETLKKRFDANRYLDEVNTLYENVNYKVQTHVNHPDFGDFAHMTGTCEMLGAYRKQQLDTMIYTYTHFYDKLERL